MTEVLTSAQMRAIEAEAIAAGAVSGLELMERAGRGVVQAIFAQWPALAAAPFRAVVLCGPGNNGGDGFVVARLLHDWGCAVTVFLQGDAANLPPDARLNEQRWQAMGKVEDLSTWTATHPARGCDLLVDGLFGTGLARPVGGEAARCIDDFAALAASGVRIVAIDIPSGLSSDSGAALGVSPLADLTVSFHRAKLGHYLGRGAECCGWLRLVDIGLRGAVPGAVSLVEAAPDLLAKRGGHKYSHGHALILSGGPGKGGAARLAARGALRIGAGLVTLGCPPEALAENAARLDAVMLAPIHDGDALARVLQDKRLNALCLGPGLGLARARLLVPVALAAARATVLDADALSAFEGDPGAILTLLHDRCVLTPHGGEFARLFPDLAARMAAEPGFSRVDAVRAAAARAGCVVLLKGADTVIAAPEGACFLHVAQYGRAAPWLATAGAGDVLAGFIAGLLARGLPALAAAGAAAWLHAECARSFGPGLIAEDLPEILPAVLRDLGL